MTIKINFKLNCGFQGTAHSQIKRRQILKAAFAEQPLCHKDQMTTLISQTFFRSEKRNTMAYIRRLGAPELVLITSSAQFDRIDCGSSFLVPTYN